MRAMILSGENLVESFKFWVKGPIEEAEAMELMKHGDQEEAVFWTQPHVSSRGRSLSSPLWIRWMPHECQSVALLDCEQDVLQVVEREWKGLWIIVSTIRWYFTLILQVGSNHLEASSPTYYRLRQPVDASAYGWRYIAS